MDLKRTGANLHVVLRPDVVARTIQLEDVVIDIDPEQRLLSAEFLFLSAQLQTHGVDTNTLVAYLPHTHASFDPEADSMILRILEGNSVEQPLISAVLEVSSDDRLTGVQLTVPKVVAESTLFAWDARGR